MCLISADLAKSYIRSTYVICDTNTPAVLLLSGRESLFQPKSIGSILLKSMDQHQDSTLSITSLFILNGDQR